MEEDAQLRAMVSAWPHSGDAPRGDLKAGIGQTCTSPGLRGVPSPPPIASGVVLNPLFIPIPASEEGRAPLSDTNPI